MFLCTQHNVFTLTALQGAYVQTEVQQHTVSGLMHKLSNKYTGRSRDDRFMRNKLLLNVGQNVLEQGTGPMCSLSITNASQSLNANGRLLIGEIWFIQDFKEPRS